MSIYRLSRVGFQMSRQLARGKSSFLNRIGCLERTHLLQPLFEKCSETGLSQHAMLENGCHFCTTATESTLQEEKEQETISVTFVDEDGVETQIKVPIGMSMLEVAHENDIELEGACEGSLACSTCHVVVMDMEYYNKLEDPIDEENDMLDMVASGLTETSRMGCQVIARPELDGIRLALPKTRNFVIDRFVPKLR